MSNQHFLKPHAVRRLAALPTIPPEPEGETAFASTSQLDEAPHDPVDLDVAAGRLAHPNDEPDGSPDEPTAKSEGLRGTAVADQILEIVRPSTAKAMAQAQRVAEAAMNLRDQLKVHDDAVEAELRARDAHTAQVIKDHGEFVTAANVEFEKALESLGIIAGNHVIEDGKGAPTRSDT